MLRFSNNAMNTLKRFIHLEVGDINKVTKLLSNPTKYVGEKLIGSQELRTIDYKRNQLRFKVDTFTQSIINVEVLYEKDYNLPPSKEDKFDKKLSNKQKEIDKLRRLVSNYQNRIITMNDFNKLIANSGFFNYVKNYSKVKQRAIAMRNKKDA